MRYLLPLILCGCSGPGKSWPARAAYTLCPQTVAVGVFVPEHEIRNTHNTALISLTATYQLKPFLPPCPPPSLTP